MDIYADARPFYGDLYRIHPNLAMSINNKCHYSILWLYGLYTVLHSLPEIEQVLLMYEVVIHRLLVDWMWMMIEMAVMDECERSGECVDWDRIFGK